MIERKTKLVDVFTVNGIEYESLLDAQIAELAEFLESSKYIYWGDVDSDEVAKMLLDRRYEVAELLGIAPVQADGADNRVGFIPASEATWNGNPLPKDDRGRYRVDVDSIDRGVFVARAWVETVGGAGMHGNRYQSLLTSGRPHHPNDDHGMIATFSTSAKARDFAEKLGYFVAEGADCE